LGTVFVITDPGLASWMNTAIASTAAMTIIVPKLQAPSVASIEPTDVAPLNISEL